jgi:hypothetical protein
VGHPQHHILPHRVRRRHAAAGADRAQQTSAPRMDVEAIDAGGGVPLGHTQRAGPGAGGGRHAPNDERVVRVDLEQSVLERARESRKVRASPASNPAMLNEVQTYPCYLGSLRFLVILLIRLLSTGRNLRIS